MRKRKGGKVKKKYINKDKKHPRALQLKAGVPELLFLILFEYDFVKNKA